MEAPAVCREDDDDDDDASTERLFPIRPCDRSFRNRSAGRHTHQIPLRPPRLQDELAEEESDEDGCYDDQERGERAGAGLSSNQRAGVGRGVFAALELSQSQALVLINTNTAASERCIMGSHFNIPCGFDSI